MTTHEAIQVLRDLQLDDLLDDAQHKALRMAIAALADVEKEERKELAAMRRWNAQSTGQFCEHRQYRSLCPVCSDLA